MSLPHDPRCGFCGAGSKEVEKLIKGDALNVYICDSCIYDALDVIEDFVPETIRRPGTEKPTPKQIKTHLDKYVIGQEEAKVILSVAVYNHYKRIGKDTEVDIRKSNVILVGPTGSGKTHIIETIAKFLQVPFATADATSMTEAGYVGDDVDSILVRLVQSCDGDIRRAERGIVYIDEVDKIAAREGKGRDVSGEGVQQGLLKLVEGSVVQINPQGKKNANAPLEMIDTKDILFIVGGAFSGITDRANERPALGLIEKPSLDVRKEVNHKELVRYGMIPEFVGRFPVLAQLDPLTEHDLIRILTEPKDALTKQYAELLALDDVKITFSTEFLAKVAEKAKKEGTGARGLRAIMEAALTRVMFEAPDSETKELCVTPEFLEEKKNG